MTRPVHELLDSFNRLSESERREAASEILRRKPDELKLVDVIQLERLRVSRPTNRRSRRAAQIHKGDLRSSSTECTMGLGAAQQMHQPEQASF